ncbi:hypothetical protein HDF14_005161 [Edaphobacter lichenicola]|jgi:hypothetical protein|uniref:Uncharacterized protein n=1 Tax=Tunturiibacter gelidiferens TaxID=3069689 RepID=A0A9X0QK10_9BACT|nr:hypothetical protein [Edaphobacter lichenicola]
MGVCIQCSPLFALHGVHESIVAGQSNCREHAASGGADPKMGFIPAFIRMQMLDKRMARAIQHKN